MFRAGALILAGCCGPGQSCTQPIATSAIFQRAERRICERTRRAPELSSFQWLFRPCPSEWYVFYPEGPSKEGRFVMIKMVPARLEVVSPPEGVASGENEWCVTKQSWLAL